MPEKRVLAIFNPISGDQRAILTAARIARNLDWQLEIRATLHYPEYALDMFHISGALETARQDLAQESQTAMRELAAEYGFPDAPIDALWAHPFDRGILQTISDHKPDLMVIALRQGHRPSSAEWRLISGCPVPLLVIRTQGWQGAANIMSCIDPTHSHAKPALLDQLILDWGLRIAAAEKSPLTILHAAGLPPALSGSDLYPDEYRQQIETDRRAEILQQLPQDEHHDSNICFTHSSPIEGIKAFVLARGIDLCVLGSMSRSWIEDRLIGGTVRALLSDDGCDLLLIPPKPE